MNILGSLRGVSIDQAVKVLDEKGGLDPNVGIVVAPMDVPSTTWDGQEYHFYAARVLPGKRVAAHVHGHGREPYLCLQGKGSMSVGSMEERDSVRWGEPKEFSPNDTIMVEEGQVHSLANVGDEEIIFLFACPEAHLSSDRVMAPTPS